MSYKLSAVLNAHRGDVRGVASPANNLVLSASRDTTAVAWAKPSSTADFHPTVLKPGQRYVSCITYIPPSDDAPEGYVVTGGQDSVISVFSLANGKSEPDLALSGHRDNVCAIHALPDGTIVSGSWDRTAKVWKIFKEVFELRGHEQSVWAVVAIDHSHFLTGSADKTIKLWESNKLIKTYEGHTDAVRGLVQIPDVGFASCSNDSSIRVWTMEGDVVYTLYGHTSFIYSLAILPSGDLISSGEDRSVRVWRDGECAQAIIHPAISVWTVSVMPNGDIVSGSSDGVVRIFSASQDRHASAEQIKEYEELVASSALPAEQIGDLKKSDLPGPEALSQPGTKAGEVKVISNNGKTEAYTWDTASYQWQKAGEVVDAIGSGRKKTYKGREYDYVFDVDISSDSGSGSSAKLPYNAGENEWVAAQRFIDDNPTVGSDQLGQIVEFIQRNANGGSLNSGAANEFVDPYTGASRHQPSQAPTQSSRADVYMDPFTGASRYQPVSSQPTPAAPAPVVNDPWTGASRYSATTVAATAPPTAPTGPRIPQGFPMKIVRSFRSADVRAMRSKLLQLNEGLKAEISTSSLALYFQEVELLDQVFDALKPAVDSSSTSMLDGIKPDAVEAICHVLRRWPLSHRFPVIDLARLVLAYCSFIYRDANLRRQLVESMFDGAEWQLPWAPPIPKARDVNNMFVLRGLANLFELKTQEGMEGNDKELQLRDLELTKVVFEKLVMAPYSAISRNPRQALATLMFNLSVNTLEDRLEPSVRDNQVKVIFTILSGEITNLKEADPETIHRTLAAFGNILYTATITSNPLSPEQIRQAKDILASIPSSYIIDPQNKGPAVRGVANDIAASL